MFSSKGFMNVNREERQYCTLLAHSLISSKEVPDVFFKLINQKVHKEIVPKHFEIYTEISALRDYWFDLGDPRKYLPETKEKRIKVLNKLIEIANYIPSLENFFVSITMKLK
jgi:hypothetical protein